MMRLDRELDEEIAKIFEESTIDPPITEISGWSMRKRGPWTF